MGFEGKDPLAKALAQVLVFVSIPLSLTGDAVGVCGGDFGNNSCLQSWAVGRDKLSWLGVTIPSPCPHTLLSIPGGLPLRKRGSDTPQPPDVFGKSPQGTFLVSRGLKSCTLHRGAFWVRAESLIGARVSSWSCPGLSGSAVLDLSVLRDGRKAQGS